jgi:hypothetical protein
MLFGNTVNTVPDFGLFRFRKRVGSTSPAFHQKTNRIPVLKVSFLIILTGDVKLFWFQNFRVGALPKLFARKLDETPSLCFGPGFGSYYVNYGY